MRQVRSAALSRHVAPPFVMLSGLELLQLRKLPHLAYRLFLEILALDKDGTGRISTSYAVLLALLDFDQVACAHAPDKPTLQRVRTALDALASAHLVRLDRIKNEKAKGLFFRVQPRSSISASNDGNNRLSNRPAKPAKPASKRPAAGSTPPIQQTEQQGIQEEKPFPKVPVVHTPTKAPSAVREAIAKLPRGAARGGETRAPKGADPSGLRPTPPGAAPPVSPQGDPFPPEQPSTDRRGGKGAATMRHIGAALG